MPPRVNMEMCQGAGDCYDVCPADPNVFEIKDGKAHAVNEDACIDCGACEASCPVGAITMD